MDKEAAASRADPAQKIINKKGYNSVFLCIWPLNVPEAETPILAEQEVL